MIKRRWYFTTTAFIVLLFTLNSFGQSNVSEAKFRFGANIIPTSFTLERGISDKFVLKGELGLTYTAFKAFDEWSFSALPFVNIQILWGLNVTESIFETKKLTYLSFGSQYSGMPLLSDRNLIPSVSSNWRTGLTVGRLYQFKKRFAASGEMGLGVIHGANDLTPIIKLSIGKFL